MIVKIAPRDPHVQAVYTGLPTEVPQEIEAWGWKKQILVTLLVYISATFVKRMKIYEPARTPPDQFVDAASVLFPHLSNSSPRSLQSPYFVTGRPDIKSFLFDLGGSTCACTLQYDKAQYWQRLFYGQKYVLAHVMTAFTGPFFVPCWEWNAIYKVMNEVLEELATPIYGKWAGTGKPMDMEPRYDSLVNDLILSGFVFIILASHVVYVLGLPNIADYNLHWDCQSCYTLFTAFFQYYTLQSIQTLWEVFGSRAFKMHMFGFWYLPGNLFAFALQVAYMRLLWLMRAWEIDTYNKTVGCLVLLWSPLTFFTDIDNYHEQIQAILSFALVGIAVSAYQYYVNIGNQKILCFASVCYALAMVFYLSFQIGPLIAVPVDQFYTKRLACGISDRRYTDSCQSLNTQPP